MTLRRPPLIRLLAFFVAGPIVAQTNPLLGAENQKDWRLSAVIRLEPDPRSDTPIVGFSTDWVANGLAGTMRQASRGLRRQMQRVAGPLQNPDGDAAFPVEILWPVIASSSSSILWAERGVSFAATTAEADPNALVRGTTGTGGRPVYRELAPELGGYYAVDNGDRSDQFYARAEVRQSIRPTAAGAWRPAPMTWHAELRTTTWDTRLNERAAAGVPWTDASAWPEHARLWLGEQADRPAQVADLAEALTNSRAATQPPVVVAKWVAGELARRFEPAGDSVEFPIIKDPDGEGFIQNPSLFEGIETAPDLAEVAASLRGSSFDLPILLVEVYRQLGIPARLVVGYATGGLDGIEIERTPADQTPRGLHAWAEFALLDPRTGAAEKDRLVWVPVDPLRLRDRGEFRRDFTATWDGFGTCTHLSDVIPLSFFLHPPLEDAVSFSLTGDTGVVGVDGIRLRVLPSLWGLRAPVQTIGLMKQWIRLSASSVASNDTQGRPEHIE